MSDRDIRPAPAPWWRERLSSDLPASFVVFLVALPLSMGIAIASGAPVTSGLVAGIVGGIVTGLLAGAPLQVSGPAAGLSVIIYQCIRQYGIEELGIVVLLAGGLQVIGGLLKLGQWFRAVSPAVIQGMLAGIGVLIFASQFHVMVDDKPKETGLANLLTIPQAIAKSTPWGDSDSEDLPDSTTRLEILKQAGMLHLKQTEIGEEVHHLLTGIAGPLVPRSADEERSKNEAVEPAAGVETQTPEQLAAAGLQRLAQSQQLVLTSLEELVALDDSETLRTALRDGREALADLTTGNVHTARASQDRAADSLAEVRDSVKNHRTAALLGVLTIALLVFWQTVAARRMRFVPAPLIAVLVVTVAAVLLDLPVLYVEVPDNLLEEVYWPSLAELKSAVNPELLLMAVQIAIVASAQTLLSATAVDQLHSGPRTQYDRELMAQGVGNMACGFLSALPLAGVIVRSSANIQAGAKSRWSTVLHGVWLLGFVAGLSFILRMIPTASLAAILVYTGYKLINPQTVRTLWKYGRSEAAIYVATLVSIVAFDLLVGVMVGLGLSILKLLATFTFLRISLRIDPEQNRATLLMKGSATFLKLPRLAQALEEVPPGAELHVQLERLTYIDHACLDLLMNWEKQHETTGGRLVVDWDSLTARFRSPPLTSSGEVPALTTDTHPPRDEGSHRSGHSHERSHRKLRPRQH